MNARCDVIGRYAKFFWGYKKRGKADASASGLAKKRFFLYAAKGIAGGESIFPLRSQRCCEGEGTCLFLYVAEGITGTEEQGNAPYACQADDREDNAAQKRGRTSADPADNVKLKQSDATPVEGTHHSQKQRDSIDNHRILTPFPFGMIFLEIGSKSIPTAFSMHRLTRSYCGNFFKRRWE